MAYLYHMDMEFIAYEARHCSPAYAAGVNPYMDRTLVSRLSAGKGIILDGRAYVRKDGAGVTD